MSAKSDYEREKLSLEERLAESLQIPSARERELVRDIIMKNLYIKKMEAELERVLHVTK